MKLGVFISWSGPRSKQLAREIAEWLPCVLSAVSPWMSEKHIDKGERWSEQVGRRLKSDRIGIICVTPENLHAPWLTFEAGAISRAVGDSKVCPLLLGMTATEVDGPLSQFQSTVFSKEDVWALISSLNRELKVDRDDDETLKRKFEKFWPDLEEKVIRLSNTPIASEAVPSVIGTFAKTGGFPEPKIGSTVYFESGFESHSVYTAVCSIAKTRLYNFGRKNRKIFDRDHADFFERLPKVLREGFDFRCLFLDPHAPEHVLSVAHQDADFSEQLKTSIRNAISALKKVGLEPDEYCRTYSVQRSFMGLVVDDAVLYTHVRHARDGRALPLTKQSFTLVNSSSPAGSDFTAEFLEFWESGQAISSALD
jgi:hypothetical protein